eukprot:scaffold484054_cov22-Prasinocladus_malaysianus.AAC.1
MKSISYGSPLTRARALLCWQGAGPFLWKIAQIKEASFDGSICSGAAYIWIFVAASKAGLTHMPIIMLNNKENGLNA